MPSTSPSAPSAPRSRLYVCIMSNSLPRSTKAAAGRSGPSERPPLRHPTRRPCEKGTNMETGLIAIGAGLAVGLGAIATGIAQARIGSAGIGAIVEKPELLGRVILLIALPETLVILGFAVAAMVIMLLPS